MNKTELLFHMMRNKELTIPRAINMAKCFVSYKLKFKNSWGKPYALMVEPTNFCNIQCPSCPTGNKTLNAPRGYMNLDNFKKINDSYGHGVGDAVLVGVANRLRKCVRKSDMIVRLGGDEFLIVSNGFKGEEQIESLADKILGEFGSPFTVGNNILKVDISIGISVNIDNNFDTETLIQCADEAMYVAKEKAGSARHYHQIE